MVAEIPLKEPDARASAQHRKKMLSLAMRRLGFEAFGSSETKQTRLEKSEEVFMVHCASGVSGLQCLLLAPLGLVAASLESGAPSSTC